MLKMEVIKNEESKWFLKPMNNLCLSKCI